MPKDHLSWCKSALYDAVGLSDSTLAEFFVEKAKTSKYYSDLLTRVQSSGMVEVDKSFVSFAKELFRRVGTAPKVKGPSQLEIDTLKMQEKRYAMVDFDTEKPKKEKKKKSKKEKSAP